jgi:hypothetical protein
MTTAVRALLESFEALSQAEQQEAAIELLRHFKSPQELSDNALVELVEGVFRGLDERESADALR